MADIPETNEPKVAMLAIAWEMVKEIYGTQFKENTRSETIKRTTNEVLRIYTALVNGKPITGEPPSIKINGGLSRPVPASQVSNDR